MLYNGNKTSTSVGTPVRLSATSVKAAWLTIQPRFDSAGAPANAGPIAIGGKTVSLTSGYVLQVGDSAVAWPVADINWIDLYEIWLNVANSGDGVQFIYAQR